MKMKMVHPQGIRNRVSTIVNLSLIGVTVGGSTMSTTTTSILNNTLVAQAREVLGTLALTTIGADLEAEGLEDHPCEDTMIFTEKGKLFSNSSSTFYIK